ncbi:sigma-70 family RNA polymerase sigma factor [Paractinoplanes rishiriensis]|uniref:RNA polymerase sigma factor n=1 Tax=Paractinoplanes rishiriensis TaxID=1050105 RepID=A0A919K5R2_9ACTN|nr:sigma-70 family RNA polymerase sigma factor [Actinoplanes rishiriensis]GIF00110.1 hypothetical protein Ari01nite_75740 [Actinoplanes rishiriensis]
MAESEAGTTAGQDIARLVTAAQGGDEKALTELISAHLPLVSNVVGRALQSHADVDDVVQDTMVRVVRGLPGLREPERFESWLIAIAYRQVQLYLRRRRTHLQRREEIPADQPDPDGDFAERTVTELVLAGQRKELSDAAEWLDDDDRHLLSLYWRETLGEITRTQLAAALAINPKQAGVRVRRMKVRLEAVRGVVRALVASPRCAELSRVTHGWNGKADSVWRKRLTRHVRTCPRCSRHGRGLVAPEKLLLGVVSLPVVVEASATSIAKMVAAAAVVTVAAGGGFVYTVAESPAPRTDSPAVVRSAVVTPGAAPAVAPTTGAAPVPRPSAVRPTGVAAADIFVAPNGSDAGTGTLARPYATLAKALAAVRPGQTIALRGGTYRPTAGLIIEVDGEPERRITLSNYRAERPVIDASRVPAAEWTVTHRASYWTVQGLEIKNSQSHAYACTACQFNVLQRLSIHDNVRSALTLRDEGTVGNQVLDSDFFNNFDPTEGGRAGIGLGIGNGAGEGNVLRGNRAFNNADNGFDLGDWASPVTVEHNWAFGNGVNRWNVAEWRSNADGFHLGGGNPPPAAAHVLRHNAAWDNASSGFTSSGNRGALQLSNNTAFRNGADGFYLLDAAGCTVHDNVSAGNDGAPARLGDCPAQRGNAWLTGDGAAQFRSTDPSAAQGPRAAGGVLPNVDFLVSPNGAGATMSAPAGN